MTETPNYRDGDVAETTETNPKSWIAWKARAEKAEQALALRGEPVAIPKAIGVFRDEKMDKCLVVYFKERLSDNEMRNLHDALAGPLYAAPISGETAQHQISTQRALTEQAWNRQKKDQDDINDLLTRLGLSEDQFRTDGYWLNVPKILTLLREKAVSGERVRPDHSGIYPRTAAASTVCACGVMVPQNICNGIESDLVDTEAMPISGERATKPFAYALIHNENTERMLMWDKPTVRSGVYREDMDWIPLYTHAVSGERVREACAKVVEDMACPDLKPPFRAAPGHEYFTAAAKEIRALPLAAQPEGK